MKRLLISENLVWSLYNLLRRLGVKTSRVTIGGCWLFVGVTVVVVEIMFSMTAVIVVPLQLGFKCVIFLRQIFFSVMFWISPPVTPLECFVSGNVYVLEIVVRSILTFSRDGQRSSWRSSLSVRDAAYVFNDRDTNSFQ